MGHVLPVNASFLYISWSSAIAGWVAACTLQHAGMKMLNEALAQAGHVSEWLVCLRQVSTKLKVGVMWDHNGTYMEGIGFQYKDHQVLVEITTDDNLAGAFQTPGDLIDKDTFYSELCC